MSVTVRRLGQGINLAANTRTTIYTVPAGKIAILRTITMGNDSASASVLMGVTLSGSGFLWQARMENTYHSRTYQLATVLKAGEYIEVEHNTAGCYTMLQGAEMDISDGPTLHRIGFYNLTPTAQNYVVPAGKKFRIREVVIAPHNADMLFSLYIAGVGHLVKKRVTAYQPEVFSIDMTAYAGEIIGGASNTAGITAHTFISGVLEDA